MKALLFTLLLFSSSFAFAKPFVCITDSIKKAEVGWQNEELPYTLAGWPSCKAMNNTGVGLNAVSITLAAGGLYMACTGVGAPATVVVEGAAIGVQVLSLVVGQLPCDNSTEQKRIEDAAKKAVCEELQNVGISCAKKL